MSEKTDIENSLKEIQQGYAELKTQVKQAVDRPELASDPLFKENKEAVDTMLDKHEDLVKTTNDLVSELSKIKSSGGYTDEQKAVKEKSLKAAFNSYIKGGGRGAVDECYKAEVEQFQKDYNISGSDALGGIFVRAEHSNEIISRVFETSPLRGLAAAQTIGGNEFVFPVDFSEPGVGRRAETEGVNETDGSSFFEVSIPVHEMYAYPRVSTQLLDDASIDMEAYVSNAVVSRFSRLEATDFIIGDGSKKAKGLLTYENYASPSVDEHNKIEQIETETVDKIDYLGTLEMIDSLLDDFQGNARLMMQRQTRTKLRRLLDDDNRPLWEPSLVPGIPATWLGFPIVTASDMGKVETGGGATGNLVMAFGDFAQAYQIVDRMGIRIIRDEITKPGFVRWIMTRRVGGGLRNGQAVKLLRLKA